VSAYPIGDEEQDDAKCKMDNEDKKNYHDIGRLIYFLKYVNSMNGGLLLQVYFPKDDYYFPNNIK